MTKVSAEAALRLGEKILTERAGSPVTIKRAQPIQSDSDAVLVRGVTSNTTFLPKQQIVIKVFPQRSADRDGLLLREFVGYQFVDSLSSAERFGPALIAYDLGERAIVLSDLGESKNLHDYLAEADNAAKAPKILVKLARLIGRMQIATAGREEDFHALLRLAEAKTKGVNVPYSSQLLANSLTSFPNVLADKLGVTLGDYIAERGEHAARRALQGSYRAFSPAELIPENILITSAGVQLLDFAFCGYRDIGVDIAAILLGFPSDPVDYELAGSVIDDIVAAWVEEVDSLWPRMRRFPSAHRRILDGALTWVWLTVRWVLDCEELSSAKKTGDIPDELKILLNIALRNLDRLDKLASYWGMPEYAEHAQETAQALRKLFD